jgi:gamma-resorcylate decarboxylase
VTTSGNFSTEALFLTMRQIGADRVMFSVDWPFEEIEHAATWFDRVDIGESDRLKIGRSNAARLLKLALP